MCGEAEYDRWRSHLIHSDCQCGSTLLGVRSAGCTSRAYHCDIRTMTVAWDDLNAFVILGTNGFALGRLGFGAASAQDTCFRGCRPGMIVNLSAVQAGPLERP